MAKLTRDEVRKHNQALGILEKDKLLFEDKLFVLENWHEGATNNNSAAGAFFTPYGLSRDFKLEIFEEDNRLIDLCAGIGGLSLPHYTYCEYNHIEHNITCIELNGSYIEVGKKILPNANWVQMSALNLDELKKLGQFTQVISNPPFGKIKTANVVDSNKELLYKGSEFEMKIMEIGSKIADYGTFLVPQGSTPFRYSGAQYFQDLRTEKDMTPSSKVKKFIKETGLEYQFGVGIDTIIYLDEWKGVKPLCEVVNFDYSGKYY